MALWLGGYGLPSLQAWSHAQSFPSLGTPLEKPGCWVICNRCQHSHSLQQVWELLAIPLYKASWTRSLFLNIYNLHLILSQTSRFCCVVVLQSAASCYVCPLNDNTSYTSTLQEVLKCCYQTHTYTHTHFCISFKEDEVDMKNSFVNKFKFLSFTAEVQVLHCTCLWWFLQCNVLCKVSWRLQNGWLYCTYFLFSKYRSYFLGFLVQK